MADRQKHRWRRYGLRWIEEIPRDGVKETVSRERWFWTNRARRKLARQYLTPQNLATWMGRPW